MPPSGNTANRHGILVVGAGELGTSVLNALSRRSSSAQEKTEITVLLRPSTAPGRAQLRRELASEGIVIEEADVSSASPAELVTIMSRFHTVVSCVVDEQLDVRDLLRSQYNTEWIIVSTGMFTSFLFEPSFGVVDLAEPAVHALGGWDTEVTVTTAEDIGVLTAEILYTIPPLANQVVYVAGDTVSYGELADIVERVVGAPVRRAEWTVEHLLDDLGKRPLDTMAKYRAVFAQGKGVAWPKEMSFNAVNGIPTTGAEEWASTHLIRGRS
ncbi:NmrA family NAD(P)-binding protein [Mycolicibacterium sp. S2-37]|uniref:NmrA family NAD(P)-binding protein n=1 Tax=Mycolicibacterium sp. S2-37 TaxID=2810297 RepID=UPI001A94E938|nr:NmrA family NAD(P)-binding protein [Mycolicibacterium sp. S2-37]MBO0678756.1 NmrA family NAD(P)-binding protein [Mycolicibacterium sp. S2-37]